MRLLWENLKLRPYHIDQAIQYGGPRFVISSNDQEVVYYMAKLFIIWLKLFII